MKTTLHVKSRVAFLLFFYIAFHVTETKSQEIELLWPNGIQDSKENEQVVNRDVDLNEFGLNRSISQVSKPTMTTYLPPIESVKRIAVIICPGGGFGRVVIDKEGNDVARWLNTIGITGFVLKYRTGMRGDTTQLEDVKRAIRIVRSRAKEMNIDTNKIGLIGFSAGGYIAASLATSYDEGQVTATDPIDRFSCKPNFLGLIYPAIPEDIENNINNLTAPTFLIHADDDHLPAENSLGFYQALRKVEVSAEIHIYAKGGHGFGLGVNGGTVATWPERFKEWLQVMEILDN